jgi:hypothetical protein
MLYPTIVTILSKNESYVKLSTLHLTVLINGAIIESEQRNREAPKDPGAEPSVPLLDGNNVSSKKED